MAKKTKEEKKKGFAKGKKIKGEEVLQAEQNNSFRFDEEIVIGVTKVEQPVASKRKTNKPDYHKSNQKNKKRQVSQKKMVKKQVPMSEEELIKKAKKRKKMKKIVGFTSLAIILVASTIAVMLSPIFNIQTISVQGNNQISTDEIISLSGITMGENIFKIGKGKAKENIKQNAYIDKVTIQRNLPSEIQIIVTERVATFMIEKDNQYLYINNQGYLLELTSQKLEIPILQGLETTIDQLTVGNRLCKEDLTKLETVLRIMNLATENDIASYITRIGIEEDSDYKLVMETEQKIVHMGDNTNLSDKILNVKSILEKEKGVAGEIFVNMNLNDEYPMFRQNVNV